jgi:hypothetical protein
MLCLSVASATESRLSNISVRSKAGSDSETLIVGFAISGEGPKQIVLRGVGPSLLSYGVPTPLADPQLALFSGPTQIDKNDNWGGSEMLASAFRALGAFPLPSDSADAALVKSLGPGNYTAHLLSPAMTGIALIECYDADGSGSTSSLSNVSARSVAGTGADVLTVGFVITGDEPKTVLIRGVGPALSDYGVTGVLRWPELRLFDASGIPIGDNWGWMTDVTPRSLFEHVGAFALRIGSSDAVLFLALPAGTYSAQLSGIGNTTGTALIEVYAVDHSPVPFVTLQQ